VGIGALLIPWTLLVAWWLIGSIRRGEPRREQTGHVVFWSVGLAMLLILWGLAQGGQPGPNWPVFGYGVCLTAGCLAAGLTAVRRAERCGIPGQLVWDLAWWLILPGLIGARIWYLVQKHEHVFRDKNSLGERLFAVIDFTSGGIVLYGGILAALVSVTWFAWRHRQECQPLLLADIVIPSFFLALAFGRLGCFLNGCCWGDPCGLPWAVTFPRDSVPFNALLVRGLIDPGAAGSLPLHPTQVYSALNALVLSAVTAAVFSAHHRHGQVMAVGLIAYPLTRLVLERLRNDEAGQFGTALTVSQWFSLLLLAAGIGFAAWLARRPTALPSQADSESAS